MMNKKIGFIGCGNMGMAMIGGIIKADLVSGSDILIFDLDINKTSALSEGFGTQTMDSIVSLVEASDYIVLAVKPNVYNLVLEEIKEVVGEKVLITIAAGVSIRQVESIVGSDKKIIRTMPNTPALVGEGMSAICKNENIAVETLAEVKEIFESFGKAEVVNEYLIDSVIAVSGSAPAYIFMLIEAMADAAVLGGMPRNQAYTFASQAVIGSAKMVMETGKHPGELKDMVCSPGGTTIEAVRVLEKSGFRSSVIEGMIACIEKSKKMSE